MIAAASANARGLRSRTAKGRHPSASQTGGPQSRPDAAAKATTPASDPERSHAYELRAGIRENRWPRGTLQNENTATTAVISPRKIAMLRAKTAGSAGTRPTTQSMMLLSGK